MHILICFGEASGRLIARESIRWPRDVQTGADGREDGGEDEAKRPRAHKRAKLWQTSFHLLGETIPRLGPCAASSHPNGLLDLQHGASEISTPIALVCPMHMRRFRAAPDDIHAAMCQSSLHCLPRVSHARQAEAGRRAQPSKRVYAHCVYYGTAATTAASKRDPCPRSFLLGESQMIDTCPPGVTVQKIAVAVLQALIGVAFWWRPQESGTKQSYGVLLFHVSGKV